MTFTGKDLRQERQQRGLTQEELANLLGVTMRTVWRWEQGERPNKLGRKAIEIWFLTLHGKESQ